jgi:hypothetical protein
MRRSRRFAARSAPKSRSSVSAPIPASPSSGRAASAARRRRPAPPSLDRNPLGEARRSAPVAEATASEVSRLYGKRWQPPGLRKKQTATTSAVASAAREGDSIRRASRRSASRWRRATAAARAIRAANDRPAARSTAAASHGASGP